ncbi:multiubiquitin domain-containing protein [Confluentibacter sediminis]|uniref:multiubiquitin domain-containing protein n=1 Tax=Confluentibacter sediminis TaxID=2219045 RepID=UPI000DADFEEF|nr:multiubiquitin domain-containing protein [Confluentibacter sediminis]
MENKTHLKECYCSGVKPALAYEYIIHINETEFSTKNQTIIGNDLHKLAGTSSDTHFIRMVTKKGKIEVGPLIKIDLTECGIERFIILPYIQETIDLENCFCEGVKPVITYKYIIKINGKQFTIEQEKISREEILKLVDKNPEKHRLRMFTRNGKEILQPGQIIDLTECGVERFVYEALDCTEGFISTNTIELPKQDLYYLSSITNLVDFVKNGNLNWLVIRDLDIPDGYNVKKADAAILIPPHYPTSQLDMIYFHPALSRTDGKMIGTLRDQSIEGKIYQRWSRHRTAINKWNPEIDNVESHLDLMLSCLRAEFNKR